MDAQPCSPSSSSRRAASGEGVEGGANYGETEETPFLGCSSSVSTFDPAMHKALKASTTGKGPGSGSYDEAKGDEGSWAESEKGMGGRHTPPPGFGPSSGGREECMGEAKGGKRGAMIHRNAEVAVAEELTPSKEEEARRLVVAVASYK